MISKKIIYAPYINHGGGKKLLLDLLYANDSKSIIFFIDSRIKNDLNFKFFSKHNLIFIKRSFFSVIISELKLYFFSDKFSKILCLHGAPPLIRNPGHVTVFFQNRLYFSQNRLFSLKKIIRKYFFLSSFNFCEKVIVQTESMKVDLIRAAGPFFDSKKVYVLPFGNFVVKTKNFSIKKQFDFIYVADGNDHKNHLNLLLAWVILAKNGMFPSLALTIPKSDMIKISLINKFIFKYKLNVKNLFTVQSELLTKYYLKSRALIYPSYTESFGLPLAEAVFLNIPILASELDFVRDVCTPKETFDPNSPLSISRAVERFLNVPKKANLIATPSQFLKTVFHEST